MSSYEVKLTQTNMYLNNQFFCIQKDKKSKKKAETFNFSALHLIHDPQSKLTLEG